jgi:cytochrome c553
MMRFVRLAAWVVPVVFIAACEKEGAEDHDDGPKTAADTIALGRQAVMSSGCGDCHGGGQNPSAPNYLVGWREGTDDTLFVGAYRIPTPAGVFQTRPRNLTPDDETGLGRFTERQIFNAIRYGLRPGETPDADITGTTPGQGNYPEAPKYLAPPMPWPAFRFKSDLEIKAIAAYLKRGVKPAANKVEPSEGPPDFWAGLYQMFGAIGPATAPAFPSEREAGPAAK